MYKINRQKIFTLLALEKQIFFPLSDHTVTRTTWKRVQKQIFSNGE